MQYISSVSVRHTQVGDMKLYEVLGTYSSQAVKSFPKIKQKDHREATPFSL